MESYHGYSLVFAFFPSTQYLLDLVMLFYIPGIVFYLVKEPSFIYQSSHQWAFGQCFFFFNYNELSCYEHFCTSFCGHKHSFLLDACPGMELLSSGRGRHIALVGTASFPCRGCHLQCLQQCLRVSTSPALGIVSFRSFCHFRG